MKWGDDINSLKGGVCGHCSISRWRARRVSRSPTSAARVVNVADGDTLTVLVSKTQIRVRLDSIDAPEIKQAFGKRSQKSLGQLCTAKTARVTDTGRDRYERTIGWVVCDGVEANTEQVRRGMAWVFVKYAAANSPLYTAEAGARRQRLGLWADPRPVAPWEWRANRR